MVIYGLTVLHDVTENINPYCENDDDDFTLIELYRHHKTPVTSPNRTSPDHSSSTFLFCVLKEHILTRQSNSRGNPNFISNIKLYLLLQKLYYQKLYPHTSQYGMYHN